MMIHTKLTEVQVEQMLELLKNIEAADPYQLTNQTMHDLQEAEVFLTRINEKIRGCRDV